MNKENAHLFLPLVQAFAEGKTIQYAGANWEDVEELVFSEYDKPKDFRIKPAEPRKFEVWLTLNGHMYPAVPAVDWALQNDTWQRITVQEVLE
jgi:hypothetical protein